MAKKSKVRVNSDYKNDVISTITGDVINTYDVIDLIGDQIEYEDGVLPISDSLKLYDSGNGGIHYIFNLDLPSKVEANNLKLLRRSNALHNIFKYQSYKKFDLVGFMPWLIIVLLVLFK